MVARRCGEDARGRWPLSVRTSMDSARKFSAAGTGQVCAESTPPYGVRRISTSQPCVSRNIEIICGTLMGMKELNDPKTKKFIGHLLGLPHNGRCADCGKNSPTWCAWTYGFFVCYECAGQHRKLGPGASRIKNAAMDTWSEEELRRMYAGGNKFAYKIPPNSDILMKYRDCGGFVAELDHRCEVSRTKEPGDSFMNVGRRPSTPGFGSTVIKKKAVPRFSDNAPKKSAANSAESEQETDSCMVRMPVRKEKPADTSRALSDVALLSRKSKGLAKMPSNVEKSRSPFSFSLESREEDNESD